MNLPGGGPSPGDGRTDGGDVGWHRSSAHCRPAEGLEMEARRRFLRRRGDVVAPQAGSYLSLPRPFPPPSWCGARRPGDTQHEPCGTRAGSGGRRKPLDARWLPDPRPHQNRGPRSVGLGEPFINKAPEPALA